MKLFDIYYYMAEQPSHILTQTGILSSFSISKKITEDEIRAVMKNAEKKGKTEEEVLNVIKGRIMKEIVDATHSGVLPGIIIEKTEPSIIPIKHIEALNRMVTVLSDKLQSKKLDKLSMCYFINYLVGSLGLTEEDFEEFHRKIKDASEEDDFYEDE